MRCATEHGVSIKALRYRAAAVTAPAALPAGEPPIVVPLVIDTALGRLSFISTTTVFGTPVDITLSELALETFFAADEATVEALRRATGGPHY